MLYPYIEIPIFVIIWIFIILLCIIEGILCTKNEDEL